MPMPKIFDKTPSQLGYSLPAEWEKHRGTWLSWPRPEGISFPDRYHTIGQQLCEMVRQIALHEEVHINVPNSNWERLVRELFKEHKVPTRRIFFHHIKTNENWCRDHGPAFVKNGKKMAIVDWGFNAWGGKYPPYGDDDAVPTKIAEEFKLPVFYPEKKLRVESRELRAKPSALSTLNSQLSTNLVIMEGGAIDVNGKGTLLTTTDCLLNKNRNPDLSKSEIEQYLKDYYGQSHICWLTGGIDGDDTDGHVDDLARFIDPHIIVIGMEEDPKDANYKILQSARKQLAKLRDQDGQPFHVVEIPMPKPVIIDGQRCPATYVNFYFVNGALLVPTYRDKKNDQKALDILQRLMPSRKVIGVDCTNIIWGLGAIHCLTQQMPA